MAFGTTTIVSIDGIGRGSRARVQENLDLLGRNIVIVTAGRTRVIAGRKRQTETVTTLTAGDAEAVAQRMRETISAVTPQNSKTLTIIRGPVSHAAEVIGVGSQYPAIRNTSTAQGRFFSKSENRTRVRIAVLGHRVYQTLFPEGGNASGAMIRINRIPFQVIGVMKPRGAALSGQDEDNQIFVPLNTALRRLFNVDHVESILFQVRDGESMDKAMSAIGAILRERHRLAAHHPDDFTIQTQQQVLEAQVEIASRFDEIMIVVIPITVLIAALGVFAVMTLGVNRRKPEIGLRRAIGATKIDILGQFLLEGLLLCFLGSLTGVFLSILVTSLLTLGLNIPASPDPAVMGVATFVSIAVGLASGLHPAWTAAQLNPVSALRGTKDARRRDESENEKKSRV